jgi:L-fucose isomerase and related proteins
MAKIAFIALAHPDYITNGYAAKFSSAAADIVRQTANSLIFSGQLAANIAEAREEALAAIAADADGVVLFLASWMECPVAMAAVTELKHLPLLLWGFPMWEENGQEHSTGSYVSYAMFRGVLGRVGLTFTEALGMPGDPAISQSISAFCAAANAVKRLKRAKIGLVGYTSMSIYTGTFDHVLLRWLIGPEVEQSDSYSLIRRAESFSDSECEAALCKLRAAAVISPDIGAAMLRKAMSLYLAVEELRSETDLDAVNVKCQYEFSKEYGMTMCVPLSLAAAPDFVTSCEGDILCTVSMLILQYLTGQVVAYGDAINHRDGVLKLSPCGFMPYALSSGACEVRGFMPNVGFTGIQNSFTMKAGKVTLVRLVEDVGTYHLVYFTGEGLASTKLRQGCMPALDIAPDCDLNSLVNNYSGQHFAICYGDVTAELSELAKMLHICAIRVK